MKLHSFTIFVALLASAQIGTVASAVTTPTYPAVAATVDGHPIPMDEVVAKSVLLDREFVVDRKIEAFVIHREAKRRGLEATDAQIDARIAVYRKAIAPSTVAGELKKHRMSMPE